MNYKPFTNDNTKEIIKEIKNSLPNINKSIISIDTLDLCHLIGEIERLNNIIKEAREYIEGACYLDETNYPNSLGHKQTMKVLEILDKGE